MVFPSSEKKMAGKFECRTRDARVTSARPCSLSHRRIQHKDPFKYSIALPAIYSLLLLGPNAPSAINVAFSLATIPNSSKISSVCSPVGRDSGRPDNSATFHGYVLDRLGWGSGISSDDSSAASEGDKTGTAHESVSLFRKSVTGRASMQCP